MTASTVIVWFRNDLRLHDHLPLTQALSRFENVVPFYCFDIRNFKKNSVKLPQTGPFRAKFLIESVADLKKSLKNLGSDLVIRIGYSENEIIKIARQFNIANVYTYDTIPHDENKSESTLKNFLGKRKLKKFHDNTLISSDKLPFKISDLPAIFTEFKKDVEKFCDIPTPLPVPIRMPSIPVGLDCGRIPTLQELGLSEIMPDERIAFKFIGGESEALNRVQDYIWQSPSIKQYKYTHNQLLGENYSSKFSPWLANGCLSARYVYHEIKNHEVQNIQNDSTFWLIYKLLWRDFFYFTAMRYGKKLQRSGGIKGKTGPWRFDKELFNSWKNGKTGVPFIDANMSELNLTGFMSNRGRQNVASFLVKDLNVDWRLGAAYFESMLIDYNYGNNWGNWNYIAGVGNDPRENRYYNVLMQAQRYDPKGDYVRHWLPELRAIKDEKVHQVFRLTKHEQNLFDIHLGSSYPWAVTMPATWIQYY
jgi:deoxyribodipyrimidine photo-lyase